MLNCRMGTDKVCEGRLYTHLGKFELAIFFAHFGLRTLISRRVRRKMV